MSEIPKAKIAIRIAKDHGISFPTYAYDIPHATLRELVNTRYDYRMITIHCNYARVITIRLTILIVIQNKLSIGVIA